MKPAPDGEDITNTNVDINRIRAKVGMVSQHFNLFPHMRVIDNLILEIYESKENGKRRGCSVGNELFEKGRT